MNTPKEKSARVRTRSQRIGLVVPSPGRFGFRELTAMREMECLHGTSTTPTERSAFAWVYPSAEAMNDANLPEAFDPAMETVTLLEAGLNRQDPVVGLMFDNDVVFEHEPFG